MPYVNKVKKNGAEYDIHDARIGDIGDVKTSLDGTSLVVPESDEPLPEPIITIDGVDYYHEARKAFSELEWYDAAAMQKASSLRLIELQSVNPEGITGMNVYFTISQDTDIGFENAFVILSAGQGGQLYPQPNDYSHIVNKNTLMAGYALPETLYTLGGNTPVDVMSNCTPEGVTAVYIKIDDDGTTHCYYNIGSVPTKIDSVKQGNAVIPLAVSSGNAEAGEVLTADGRGGTSFQQILPSYNYNDLGKILEVKLKGTPTISWSDKPFGFVNFGSVSEVYNGSISVWINALKDYFGIESQSNVSQTDVLAKFTTGPDYYVTQGTQTVAISYARTYKGHWESTVVAFNLGTMQYFNVSIDESDEGKMAQPVPSMWTTLQNKSYTQLYDHRITNASGHVICIVDTNRVGHLYTFHNPGISGEDLNNVFAQALNVSVYDGSRWNKIWTVDYTDGKITLHGIQQTSFDAYQFVFTETNEELLDLTESVTYIY